MATVFGQSSNPFTYSKPTPSSQTGPVSFVSPYGRITQVQLTPAQQIMYGGGGYGASAGTGSSQAAGFASNFWVNGREPSSYGSVRDPVTGQEYDVSTTKGQQLYSQYVNAKQAAQTAPSRDVELANRQRDLDVKDAALAQTAQTLQQQAAQLANKKPIFSSDYSAGVLAKQQSELDSRIESYNAQVEKRNAIAVGLGQQQTQFYSTPSRTKIKEGAATFERTPAYGVSGGFEVPQTRVPQGGIDVRKSFVVGQGGTPAGIEAERQKQLGIGVGTAMALPFVASIPVSGGLTALAGWGLAQAGGVVLGYASGQTAEPLLRETKIREFEKGGTPPMFDLGVDTGNVKEKIVQANLFPSSKLRPMTELEVQTAKGFIEFGGYAVGSYGIGKLLVSPSIGEAGGIGAGKKRLPPLIEISRATRTSGPTPEALTPPLFNINKKLGTPDLTKFLEPARPLQYEEKMFLESLKPIKEVKVKTPTKMKFVGEQLIPQKGPDLTRFLEPSRGLQYEEVQFRKAIGLPTTRTVEGLYFERTLTPFKFKSPKTTAGLSKVKQASFEEFKLSIDELLMPVEKSIVKIKTVMIPGSYAQLSQGLTTPNTVLITRQAPLVAQGEFAEFATQGQRYAEYTNQPLSKELQGYGKQGGLKFGNFLGTSTGTGSKLIQLTELDIKQAQGLDLTQTQKTLFKTKTEEKQRDLLGVASIITTSEAQRVSQRTRTEQKQVQQQKFVELTMLRPRTRIIQRVVQKPIVRLKEIEPVKSKLKQPRIPFVFELPPVYSRKPSKSFGYQVLVRTKGSKKGKKFSSGEFAPIGSGVYSKEQALSLGQAITAGSAKRSFKLAPAFGAMAETGRLPAFKPERYYRKGRTFIEKNRFAINTVGEFREISRKGQASKKSKRLFGNKPFKNFSKNFTGGA